MQCPKCASEAPDFNTSDGVVLNFCNGCSGLWFDHGELALYCETESDVPNLRVLIPQAQPTAYACPRGCDTQLVELPYMPGEAVLIDWCPACHGSWLDAKEIMKIEQLATRHESHATRLKRGIRQLEDAGYVVLLQSSPSALPQ